MSRTVEQVSKELRWGFDGTNVAVLCRGSSTATDSVGFVEQLEGQWAVFIAEMDATYKFRGWHRIAVLDKGTTKEEAKAVLMVHLRLEGA